MTWQLPLLPARRNSDAMSPVDGRTTQDGRTDLVTASVTATAQKSERDFFISLSLSFSVFDSEKIRPAAAQRLWRRRPSTQVSYSGDFSSSLSPSPLLSSLAPIRSDCIPPSLFATRQSVFRIGDETRRSERISQNASASV